MKKKAALVLLGTFMLLSGIGAGVYLIRQQQLVEKKAAVSGGIVQMHLSPQTGTAGVNQLFRVDVIVDTKGQTVKNISAVIKIPQSDNFFIQSVNANESLSQSTSWRYSPNPSFSNTEDGMTTAILSLFYSSHEGYTNPEPFVIGSIMMRGTTDTSIRARIDSDLSQVTLFPSDAEDILNSNLNTLAGGYAGIYTIGSGDTGEPTIAPTATPTPTQGTNPSPSPTTGINNSPTPSRTPTQGAGTLSPTPSRTPTSAPGGGTNPSVTPTIDTRTSISITSPQNGASLSDNTPTFTGKAAPQARILAAITGTTSTSGSITADSAGNWSWTSTALNIGSHTGTFRAYDNTDRETTASVTFTITSAGSGSGTGTGNNTGANSGTNNDTPETQLPVAGTPLPTVAMLITGLGSFALGAYFLLLKRS